MTFIVEEDAVEWCGVVCGPGGRALCWPHGTIVRGVGCGHVARTRRVGGGVRRQAPSHAWSEKGLRATWLEPHREFLGRSPINHVIHGHPPHFVYTLSVNLKKKPQKNSKKSLCLSKKYIRVFKMMLSTSFSVAKRVKRAGRVFW